MDAAASRRIRQVKREIRVLGVAAKRGAGGFSIVGVVYRGGLWLDGVLRGSSASDDLTGSVAEMLVTSPHSGQARVILLSRGSLPEGAGVSIDELRAKTGKPVIMLGECEGTAFTWRNDGETVVFSATGISHWTAEGVLKAVTREGTVPEALRVAGLILSALPEERDA